jgi:hypothetical protein
MFGLGAEPLRRVVLSRTGYTLVRLSNDCAATLVASAIIRDAHGIERVHLELSYGQERRVFEHAQPALGPLKPPTGFWALTCDEVITVVFGVVPNTTGPDNGSRLSKAA